MGVTIEECQGALHGGEVLDVEIARPIMALLATIFARRDGVVRRLSCY